MQKIVSAPLRIDLCGGSLDIQPVPTDMAPVHIVSAAIDMRVTGQLYDCIDGNNDGKGLRLEYTLPGDVSTGSGLGSSGCMNLVWLALITGERDPHRLASSVYKMEQATGVVGGVQDQFTAAYGGINLIRMSHDRVWVERLIDPSDSETIKWMTDHMVLLDTNIRRSATGMNDNFIKNYMDGKFYDELTELNELSLLTVNELSPSKTCRMPNLAAIFDREWAIRKILMPSKVDEIDNIISECKTVLMADGYECGAKVNGAAGGGCMLCWVKEARYGNVLVYGINKLVDIATSMGCTRIPLAFDFDGITIEDQ